MVVTPRGNDREAKYQVDNFRQQTEIKNPGVQNIKHNEAAKLPVSCQKRCVRDCGNQGEEQFTDYKKKAQGTDCEKGNFKETLL